MEMLQPAQEHEQLMVQHVGAANMTATMMAPMTTMAPAMMPMAAMAWQEGQGVWQQSCDQGALMSMPLTPTLAHASPQDGMMAMAIPQGNVTPCAHSQDGQMAIAMPAQAFGYDQILCSEEIAEQLRLAAPDCYED